MSFVIVLIPQEPTLTRLKDGQWVIEGAGFGIGADGYGNGSPEGQPGTSNGEGLSATVRYVLAAVQQTSGEMPAEVREAAGKLIESSCRVLAERYGDGEPGEVKIIDPSGRAITISAEPV